jgi:hypothetical protein
MIFQASGDDNDRARIDEQVRVRAGVRSRKMAPLGGPLSLTGCRSCSARTTSPEIFTLREIPERQLGLII